MTGHPLPPDLTEEEWLQLVERIQLLSGYSVDVLEAAPRELLEQILTQDVYRLLAVSSDWRGRALHYRQVLGQVSDLVRSSVTLPAPGETT